MCQIAWRVGQMNKWTSVKCLIGAGCRGGKQVAEHSGLCSQKAAVYTIGSLTSDEDDVAVIEPDLRVALEIGQGSARRGA